MSKKICILTDSLGSGGAEKMAANMSLSLTKKDFDVFVVSMLNNVSYKFGGSFYNFGLVKEKNNKLRAFLKFRKFFKKHKFDVVIDHRVRSHFFKEMLFSKFIFKNYRVIYCVHHYDLSLYFSLPKNPFISRLPHVKNSRFVSVSMGIQKHLNQILKLDSILIYNYILLEEAEKNNENKLKKTMKFDYIVAVGRLVKIKQFDVLINSYKNSGLPQKDIKLLILGEGEEKHNLELLIENLGLKELILLKGFRNDAFSFIKNAKALVLSSKFEGFPMVLIESLALKTPMISFDCKSGPNEIIKHGENGLLVPAQDKELLSKAMDKLLLNGMFYNQVKNKINDNSTSFSESNVISKWIELIKEFN